MLHEPNNRAWLQTCSRAYNQACLQAFERSFDILKLSSLVNRVAWLIYKKKKQIGPNFYRAYAEPH